MWKWFELRIIGVCNEKGSSTICKCNPGWRGIHCNIINCNDYDCGNGNTYGNRKM